jgi:hypothetical protein
MLRAAALLAGRRRRIWGILGIWGIWGNWDSAASCACTGCAGCVQGACGPPPTRLRRFIEPMREAMPPIVGMDVPAPPGSQVHAGTRLRRPL